MESKVLKKRKIVKKVIDPEVLANKKKAEEEAAKAKELAEKNKNRYWKIGSSYKLSGFVIDCYNLHNFSNVFSTFYTPFSGMLNTFRKDNPKDLTKDNFIKFHERFGNNYILPSTEEEYIKSEEYQKRFIEAVNKGEFLSEHNKGLIAEVVKENPKTSNVNTYLSSCIFPGVFSNCQISSVSSFNTMISDFIHYASNLLQHDYFNKLSKDKQLLIDYKMYYTIMNNIFRYSGKNNIIIDISESNSKILDKVLEEGDVILKAPYRNTTGSNMVIYIIQITNITRRIRENNIELYK